MRRALILALACLAAASLGCSRTRYRLAADRDAYCTLEQKTARTPWQQPGFDIGIDPRSRMFDPTPPDAPVLPNPSPSVYDYELPELLSTLDKPAPPDAAETEIVPTGSAEPAAQQTEGLPDPNGVDAPTLQEEGAGALPDYLGERSVDAEDAQRLVPIDKENWEAIPAASLARMLEFDRVRTEFVRTFAAAPGEERRVQGPQYALEEFVELALLNSREYQTQKEALYRAALALTLERFDYQTKFSRGVGGGLDVGYNHNRQGTTVNTLNTPSSAQFDRVLAAGGTLLARFANNVVLTFNGPQGFSADVSSEMFFSFSQAVLQRDIVFERLTQAERNVMYAARTYMRFRKTFFVQLASDYYALVRNYRQIEIESQNYFSLVRALNQARAELEAGLRSRIQVEQIEQSMLQGRSRLISTCVSLERNLDRYKLTLGIPPEQMLNIDLFELRDLTLRDEAAVAAQVARRTRDRVAAERGRPQPQRAELTSAAVVLADRLNLWLDLQDGFADQPTDRGELHLLQARLQLEEAQLDAQEDRQTLLDDIQSWERELAADQQLQELSEDEKRLRRPNLRFAQKTIDLIDSLGWVAGKQLRLAQRQGADGIEPVVGRFRELLVRYAALRTALNDALERAELERTPELYDLASALLTDVDALVAQGAALVQDDAPPENPADPAAELARSLELVDALVAMSDSLLAAARIDLTAIDLPVDDAMLAAVASRLDLMNQRGDLADRRRAVKLAADDLRSVLNLNASQTIGTPNNKPFDYQFDNSRTQLGLTFDLPLNRRAQRNSYRTQLINYHVGLRTLMLAEDTIKLAVRNDLRDLALTGAQFGIGVASAALARERVLSTELELRLGFPGVAARDYLEAQDAYRVALGGVADNHIGYLVNRMTFFVDLEALEVNDRGFWEQLRDEEHQPEPRYDLAPEAGAPYGYLPPWVKYSREVRSIGR